MKRGAHTHLKQVIPVRQCSLEKLGSGLILVWKISLGLSQAAWVFPRLPRQVGEHQITTRETLRTGSGLLNPFFSGLVPDSPDWSGPIPDWCRPCSEHTKCASKKHHSIEFPDWCCLLSGLMVVWKPSFRTTEGVSGLSGLVAGRVCNTPPPPIPQIGPWAQMGPGPMGQWAQGPGLRKLD